MIENFPSVGIKNVSTNQLACWCLTYDYGAMGMLHTQPVSRTKQNNHRLLLSTNNYRIIEVKV